MPQSKGGSATTNIWLHVMVHYQTIIHIQTGICFISNPRVNGAMCM